MVRIGDDALLAFDREEDARRVLEVLAELLARFGLTLLPEKTRLDFRRRPWRRGTLLSERGRALYPLSFSHVLVLLP